MNLILCLFVCVSMLLDFSCFLHVCLFVSLCD